MNKNNQEKGKGRREKERRERQGTQAERTTCERILRLSQAYLLPEIKENAVSPNVSGRESHAMCPSLGGGHGLDSQTMGPASWILTFPKEEQGGFFVLFCFF